VSEFEHDAGLSDAVSSEIVSSEGVMAPHEVAPHEVASGPLAPHEVASEGVSSEPMAPHEVASEAVAEMAELEVVASEASQTSGSPTGEPVEVRKSNSPVAAAMRELESLGQRELAEHPDVYQRIHAELQSALTTIDDA
jgi:hypothetical protein